MKVNVIEKLESLGGIKTNVFCTNDKQQVEDAFIKIEALFNSYLPTSYKEFYKRVGAFSFNNLVSVSCIDSDSIMLPGNKLNIGAFYCITECKTTSINEVLKTYQEQLIEGLLPICDGELGDVTYMSLRKQDYGYIYYFYHEGLPKRDLFLVANNFEDFIAKLEIRKGEANESEILKRMKVEITPEFMALLKKDGYGTKD